jgi:hypothetical protein
MSNYFNDNKDLQFTLENLDLEEVVRLREDNYQQAKDFDYAPEDYADAKDSFKRVLELVGEISGERIAPRARIVDEEGPHFENNKVTYHPLTVKNLEELQQANLGGVMLPRRFGGLNLPATLYTMMTEMPACRTSSVSRTSVKPSTNSVLKNKSKDTCQDLQAAKLTDQWILPSRTQAQTFSQ